MSYSALGQAVYDFATEIDISDATPEDWDQDLDWGDKFNRPPKANEFNVYPALVVMPTGDSQETGDTDVDFDSITYSVYIVFSYAEAEFAETTLREVADIVRPAFRALRASPGDLHESASDLSFAGEWGGTLGCYRLDVIVRLEKPPES